MEKVERLKKLFEVATEDRPSTKEVAVLLSGLIKTVKEALKQTEDRVYKALGSLESDAMKAHDNFIDLLEKTSKDMHKTLSKEHAMSQKEWYKALNNEVYKLEKCMQEMPHFDPKALEEKWSVVIGDLEAKIDDIKQMTGMEVRDLLEVLDGEERLDYKAVKGVVGIHKGKTPPEDKDMLWIDTNGVWVEMK